MLTLRLAGSCQLGTALQVRKSYKRTCSGRGNRKRFLSIYRFLW
jgi:hypothetical protein